MPADAVKISKLFSLVLRHKPEEIGLVLDAQGWAAVDDLVDKATAHGVPIRRGDVLEIVATSDKKRFVLSEDGSRIRAAQGHSLAVDLQLEPVEPPPILYHGTAERFLASIMAGGLTPQARQHVHLSADRATALAVGRRHGRPVVLIVDSGRMYREGHRFFRSENGVWLCHSVAAHHLTAEPVPK